MEMQNLIELLMKLKIYMDTGRVQLNAEEEYELEMIRVMVEILCEVVEAQHGVLGHPPSPPRE